MLLYSKDRDHGAFLHNALLRNPSVADTVLKEIARSGGYSVKMQAEAMLKERNGALSDHINKTLDERIEDIRDKLASVSIEPEQETKSNYIAY